MLEFILVTTMCFIAWWITRRVAQHLAQRQAECIQLRAELDQARASERLANLSVESLEQDIYKYMTHTKYLMMSFAREACMQGSLDLRMAEALAHAMPYLARPGSNLHSAGIEGVLNYAEPVALHYSVQLPTREDPTALFDCLVTMFEAITCPTHTNFERLAYWQKHASLGVSPSGTA
jgi:hypothetical protein